MSATETDLAVRAARAEIERDQALEKLRAAEEGWRNYIQGQGFEMFGHGPDYWLGLQATLRKIAATDYRGNQPEEIRLAKAALAGGRT